MEELIRLYTKKKLDGIKIKKVNFTYYKHIDSSLQLWP